MTQTKVWTNFYGGISSDEVLTTGNQVIFSEDVDVKISSKFVTLDKRPTKGVFTGGDSIYGFIEVEGDMFGYGEDGVIYDMTSITDDTPNFTPTSYDLINAVIFGDDVYFIPQVGTAITIELYKISKVDLKAGNNSFTTVSTGLKGVNNISVFTWHNAYMYLTIGITVWRIDNTGVQATFTFGVDDFIAITKSGSMFKLYEKNGRVALWDGLKTSVEGDFYIGNTIRAVQQFKGIDYILGGYNEFYTTLYYLDGYVAKELTRKIINKYGDTYNKFEFDSPFSNNGITTYNGQIYFINQGTTSWLTSYGNKIMGLPNAFNNFASISSQGQNYTNIYSVGVSGSSLYISYSDQGGEQGIDKYTIPTGVSSTGYELNGYMTLPVFTGGVKGQEKKIKQIRLKTDDISSNYNLVLKISINGGSFETVKTITDSGIIKITNYNKDFTDLAFKIEFNSLDGNSAPKFEELILFYDIIKE